MSSVDSTVHESVPGDRSLLIDALIGGVVTVVLSFVPFSQVLGGAVAGYLHRERGPRVGALSGLFASVPIALVMVLIMLGFGFFVPVGPGADPIRALFGFLVFVLLMVLAITALNVALGAVGGVLGVALFEWNAERGGSDDAAASEAAATEPATPTTEPTGGDDGASEATDDE